MVRISDLFIPPVCQNCQGKQWGRAPLCLTCLKSLKPFRPKKSLPEGGEIGLSSDFLFGHSWFLFPMTKPMSILVHGFKYRHFKRNIFFLMRYLAHRSDIIYAVRNFDAIIPVPIHKVRKRERGYNQAALIAHELSKLTGVPVFQDVLSRIRNTPSQTKLTRGERQKNLDSAIKCTQPIQVRGKKILIVDDVFTTGSTLELCAEVLAGSGCTETAIFAIAKVEAIAEKDDFKLEQTEGANPHSEMFSGFLI